MEFRYKHLPKQAEVAKHLENLKRKVIQDYQLSLSTKELIQEVKRDPYFGDIYTYLYMGRLPSSKRYRRDYEYNFRSALDDYVLVDNVLFKIHTYRNQEPRLQLCIPQSYMLTLMYQYHDEILSAHQGATRTYLTLREKFWAPHLYQNIHSYIRCCYTCQTVMDKPEQHPASFMRLPYNYRPMSRLSMDIKDMPFPSEGFRYILVIACEFTNYVVTAPLRDITARSVAEALINKVIFVFGPPAQIVCDQGTQLVSKLMIHIYERLHIDVKVVSPGNHGSLRAERFIGTISHLLQKSMACYGSSWARHLQPCTFAHNTFHSQAIGTSPYKMVYLHDPPTLARWEATPLEFGTVDTQQYLSQLKGRYDAITEHTIQL